MQGGIKRNAEKRRIFQSGGFRPGCFFPLPRLPVSPASHILGIGLLCLTYVLDYPSDQVALFHPINLLGNSTRPHMISTRYVLTFLYAFVDLLISIG